MIQEVRDVPGEASGLASDENAIVVFLVDDQAMIGEAVRRALAEVTVVVEAARASGSCRR